MGLSMVPALLGVQAPLWLMMAKLKNVPYLNELFDPTLLAKTIAEFHLATFDGQKCLCHIDNQPANILWDSGCYHLIDFEDSRLDYPELDVSHLLLFWAADVPTYRFTSILAGFLHSYTKLLPLDANRWKACLASNIITFDERRGLYHKQNGKNPPDEHLSNRKLLAKALSLASSRVG
jgi:hypothetical protein